MVLNRSAVIVLIAFFGWPAHASRVKLEVHVAEPEKNVSNECSYDKEDVYNPDLVGKSRELTWDEGGALANEDPRITIQKHGVINGVYAKLLWLGKGIINTKLVSLELSGPEAQPLAQAMYGIVTTKVPEACFPLLKDALSIDFTKTKMDELTPLERVKKKKKELLKILKEKLPYGCDEANPTPKDDPDIKRVENTLWPLWRGYWGLHEPLTIEGRSILSVRVLDELRVVRNDLRIRQIWFYGKVHLISHIEFNMRQQLAAPQISKTEEARLSRQLKNVYLLMEMADAHLEIIELDNAGSCMSAMDYPNAQQQERMLAKLASFQSSAFRVTFMFRERHWQSRGKGVSRFFDHPILALKKLGTRFADQFMRSQPPMQIGMVLQPLMKIAALSGAVLGAATLGMSVANSFIAIANQGTIVNTAKLPYAVFFAQAMMDVSIELGAATVPFIQYLVNYACGFATQSIKDFFILQGVTSLVAAKQVQGAIRFIDFVPRRVAFAEVRSQMEMMVENILTDDKVLQEIAIIRDAPDNGDEEHIALKEGVEDEVRRYVQSMVFEGFSQDTVPAIQEAFLRLHSQQDPAFGWVSWEDWRQSRSAQDASKPVTRKYNDKMLRYHNAGLSTTWEGKVIAVANKIPGKWRTLTVEMQTQDGAVSHSTVTLTDEVKSHMSIRDLEAFRKSQAGWLLWHDWSEYRKSSTAMKLKGKRIYLDVKLLPHCKELIVTQPWGGSEANRLCLSEITAVTGKHRVLSTSWKWLGIGTRVVTVQRDGGFTCSFALDPEVKNCLKVHDSDAFDRFSADTSHREKDLSWESGELRATGSIVNDIVGKVRELGQTASHAEQDRAAATLIEQECGHESSFAETEAQASHEDGGLDKSDDQTMQDIQVLKVEVDEGFDVLCLGGRGIVHPKLVEWDEGWVE